MLNTVLGILLIVMAVFLVVTILLQSSKDHRMSGTITGGAETFFGKQKGKSIDGILNKITVVVCILFFVCVLTMYVTTDSDLATINPVIDTEVEGEVVDAEVEVAEGETETEGEVAEVEGENADVEEVAEEVTEETTEEATEEVVEEATEEAAE